MEEFVNMFKHCNTVTETDTDILLQLSASRLAMKVNHFCLGPLVLLADSHNTEWHNCSYPIDNTTDTEQY